MRATSGTHASHGLWLPGAFVLLILTACATASPGARDELAKAGEAPVGYGAADTAHLASAQATVEGDREGSPRFRSMIEMLSRVPGVRVIERPGGGMSVRIRGSTSFQSDEEPLFVLDGMAMQSGDGVRGLNPNNIASITVLKDAGETAIYGARGANGVILIKTKR